MARTASARKAPPPKLPPVDQFGRVVLPPRDSDRRARVVAAAGFMAEMGAMEGERASARARIAELTGAAPPAPAPVTPPTPPAVAYQAPRIIYRAPTGKAWRTVHVIARGVELREADGITYCTCEAWLNSAMRDRAHPERARCRHLAAWHASEGRCGTCYGSGRGGVFTGRGTIRPEPCDTCAGSGKASAQPVQRREATEYVVKCDACKITIRTGATLAESAAGGRCASCASPPPDDRPVATLRRDSTTGAQWLQFPEKPAATVLRSLGREGEGWRWHGKRAQWYHGPSGKVPASVRVLDGGACEYSAERKGSAPSPVPTVQAPPVVAPETVSLRSCAKCGADVRVLPAEHAICGTCRNAPTPTGKVPVAELTITFTEGLDLSGHHGQGKCSFAGINAALRDLASRAPEAGTYQKTDVTVRWADGETWRETIDLMRQHATDPGNIAGEAIRAHLIFLSGRLAPGTLPAAAYRQLLDGYGAEAVAHAGSMLDGYQLADKGV